MAVLACKSADGRVDLADLCSRLFALDVTSVLLEGGSELNGAFLDAGLVDRVAAFVAPLVVGGALAPGAVGGRGLRLPGARRLLGATVRPLGPDWLIEGDLDDGHAG